MTTASFTGDTDGFADAQHGNPPHARKRFERSRLPEQDWATYRDAYHAAYKRVCDRLLAAAREKRGAA